MIFVVYITSLVFIIPQSINQFALLFKRYYIQAKFKVMDKKMGLEEKKYKTQKSLKFEIITISKKQLDYAVNPAKFYPEEGVPLLI